MNKLLCLALSITFLLMCMPCLASDDEIPDAVAQSGRQIAKILDDSNFFSETPESVEISKGDEYYILGISHNDSVITSVAIDESGSVKHYNVISFSLDEADREIVVMSFLGSAYVFFPNLDDPMAFALDRLNELVSSMTPGENDPSFRSSTVEHDGFTYSCSMGSTMFTLRVDAP